jgi:hypothetical protein
MARKFSGWPTALLGVVGLVLAGCSSGSDHPGSGGIHSGTLGGLAFTVLTGTVTQPAPDGPIHANSGGLVLFDDPLDGLNSSPYPEVQAGVTFTVSDGGSAIVIVYGSADDNLATGIGLQFSRNATSMDYAYHFGIDGTPEGSGTFTPDPADAAGTLSLVGNFHDGVDPDVEAISLYHPDKTFFGCSTNGNMTGPNPNTTGQGTRVGVGFTDATIESFSVADSGKNQC